MTSHQKPERRHYDYYFLVWESFKMYKVEFLHSILGEQTNQLNQTNKRHPVCSPETQLPTLTQIFLSIYIHPIKLRLLSKGLSLFTPLLFLPS